MKGGWMGWGGMGGSCACGVDFMMAIVKTLTPAEKLPSLRTRMTRASRIARRKAKEEVLEALPHRPVATAPVTFMPGSCGECSCGRSSVVGSR